MKDLGHERTDKIIETLEKRINKVYSQAKKELQEEFKKSLKWNEILKISDPKKRLIAAKKYKRLTKLIANMSEVIQNKNKIALTLIDDNLEEIYAYNFNWGAYTIEHEIGFDIGYVLYNKEAVAELIKDNTPAFTKMAYKNAKDLAKIKRELTQALTTEIIKGGGYQKLAKKIDKVTDHNNYGSIRIARTELGRMENTGKLKSFEHAQRKGVDLKKEWIATIDKRTRVSHRHVQGEIVDMKDKFSNGLKYPNDPNGSAREVINCRCTFVANIQKFTPSDAEIKLNEKFKKMSFDEWRDAHGE